MAQVTHLRNAPIVEAVIEFQVDLPADRKLNTARAAHRRIAAGYPQQKNLFSGSFEFQFGAPGKALKSKSSSKDMGLRFSSLDGRKIVDFGLKSFAFHWLAPYSVWDDLRTEAKRLWEIYLETMRPIAISRLGVRFINNLAIPQSTTDLCDYLVPGPIVPAGLPQSIQSFISRIEIADVVNKRIGIIAQSLQGLSADGKLSVLLDIDAVRVGAFVASDQAVWEIADNLRDFKNEMFFRSVTDLLLEQYR